MNQPDRSMQLLLERAASRAAMPATALVDDVRRGEASLRRRRTAVAGLALATVAVVAGAVALAPRGGDRGADPQPPAASPSATPSAPGIPAVQGSAQALRDATAAILDSSGTRVVGSAGSSAPVERGGQVSLVTATLGWQEPGVEGALDLHVRIATSVADAEWGCESDCSTYTTYDLAGGTAHTLSRDDLGLTSTLLERTDGSVVALSVPPRLLASGSLTRADVDAVLTSDTLVLPPGSSTGPAPLPGATVDDIGLDHLPGLTITTPSTTFRPAAVGDIGGAEVLWQADPAYWTTPGDTCVFWDGPCSVEIVSGVRLELSRPRGGPFAGYVAVEHQGETWRTRVMLPEGTLPLEKLVALLTDPRWED